MRQPEVARLAGFVLALALVAPVAASIRSGVVALAFLLEFLSAGAVPALSLVTAAPARHALPVAGVAVDRYRPTRLLRPPPLVLVHGLAPEGKDDPRVRRAAALLARAGFDVAVPTIAGLTRLSLRPEDVRPVVATIAARSEPTVVVGVSVGAGLALLAAADPSVRDRVATVLSLGGYASAMSLVRYYLTGDYAHGAARGHVAHDAALVRMFLEANPDLLDESVRRVLSAGDPDRITAALAQLAPRISTLLEQLSPIRVVRDIRARLILVHGRGDPAVPYTETLRLAEGRPDNTRVVLVGVVGHVEGVRGRSGVADFHDALSLWTVVYGLIRSG